MSILERTGKFNLYLISYIFFLNVLLKTHFHHAVNNTFFIYTTPSVVYTTPSVVCGMQSLSDV